jgi:hypothetical protein
MLHQAGGNGLFISLILTSMNFSIGIFCGLRYPWVTGNELNLLNAL